jgi:hypothetical protein
MTRILYLAVADARGHLMRGHLLRRLLAPEGIDVDLVTTSNEGQRFLAALGSPSQTISNHFHVEFGARHDMQFAATAARVARYLAFPRRGLADGHKLQQLAEGAAFVVNDSLHPALLAAPAFGSPLKVVQLAGENLWAAAAAHFDRTPAPVRRAYRRLLARACDRSFARITHTLGATRVDPAAHNWWLPPIVDLPSRSRTEMREALGVPDGQPLAVVYLNPHFQDEQIAEAVEQSLHARGFFVYGVSERFHHRHSWTAHDSRLADAIAAADLYLSGAGMGALEQARAYRTPFVSLLGNQPEQRRNVEAILSGGCREVALAKLEDSPLALRNSIDAALTELPARRASNEDHQGVQQLHRLWRDAFVALVDTVTRTERDRHAA